MICLVYYNIKINYGFKISGMPINNNQLIFDKGITNSDIN